jgi:hypothetical protein
MSGNQAAEVHLKLVVDDNAKAATQHVQKGLASTQGFAKRMMSKVDTSMSGNMAKLGAYAAEAGVALEAAAVAGGAAMIGMAVQSADAFMKAEEQVRGLTATLATIDQNGNSFERLHGYAEDIKDDLEGMAMKAGVTDDAMVQVFNDIIDRGGKSVDAAEQLTSQMAYAGRAVQGGPEALAAGFQNLEMGIVRARNPLVQLISSTQTLKGSAKAVATQMSKMSIDEQMALAEKAIGRMSDKMKAAPMTISQMRTAMGVGIDNLLETAGKPIVGALTPIVTKVYDLFMSNQGGLLAAAEKFGGLMAEGLGLVVPVMEQVEAAVRENWGAISGSAEELYGSVKSVFDYLYDNREAIAKTFVQTMEFAYDVAKFIRWVIEGSVKAMMPLLPVIAKLGKFVGGKAYGAGKDLLTIGLGSDLGKDEALGTASKHLRGSMLGAGAGAGGLDAASMQKVHDKFLAEYQQGGASIAEAEEAYGNAMRRAQDDHKATMDQVTELQQNGIYENADSFAKAWQIAERNQDLGTEKYLESFLENSQSLAKMVGEKGPEIMGSGFSTMLDRVKDMNSPLAAELKRWSLPNLGTDKKGGNAYFTGPINIRQDFRNQDPDRVAEVFKSDLAKYAANRLEPRGSRIIGLF